MLLKINKLTPYENLKALTGGSLHGYVLYKGVCTNHRTFVPDPMITYCFKYLKSFYLMDLQLTSHVLK